MRDDEWVFSGANEWNDDHSPADPDAFDPIFDSMAFMGQDGVLHDAGAPVQNGARNDFIVFEVGEGRGRVLSKDICCELSSDYQDKILRKDQHLEFIETCWVITEHKVN